MQASELQMHSNCQWTKHYNDRNENASKIKKKTNQTRESWRRRTTKSWSLASCTNHFKCRLPIMCPKHTAADVSDWSERSFVVHCTIRLLVTHLFCSYQMKSAKTTDSKLTRIKSKFMLWSIRCLATFYGRINAMAFDSCTTVWPGRKEIFMDASWPTRCVSITSREIEKKENTFSIDFISDGSRQDTSMHYIVVDTFASKSRLQTGNKQSDNRVSEFAGQELVQRVWQMARHTRKRALDRRWIERSDNETTRTIHGESKSANGNARSDHQLRIVSHLFEHFEWFGSRFATLWRRPSTEKLWELNVQCADGSENGATCPAVRHADSKWSHGILQSHSFRQSWNARNANGKHRSRS